jgi:hypothetical protein
VALPPKGPAPRAFKVPRAQDPFQNLTRKPFAVFHVGIDGRVPLTEVKSDQKAVNAVAFLMTAVAYDPNFRLNRTRVMVNNRSGCKACRLPQCLPGASLGHIRTKPRLLDLDQRASPSASSSSTKKGQMPGPRHRPRAWSNCNLLASVQPASL